MPSKDTKILPFNQYQKPDKAPFAIYADLECIMEKTDVCKNYPKNSSTAKVDKHISSGFSMSTISFKSIENKHDKYRGKDCLKRFCEYLREQATKTISFTKKKMKLLAKEHQEQYENAKIYYICKKKLKINILKDKEYCKVRDHFSYTGKYRGTVHSLCNSKYSVPKRIHIVFHN